MLPKDISQSELQVLTVYGSRNGVLDREKYTENLTNLPEDRKEYVIEGGCHAQFGCYGMQKGNGEPEISGEEQRGSNDWVYCGIDKAVG